MAMGVLNAVAAAIGAATGSRFEPAGQAPMGGGCINQGMALSGRDGRRYYVKFNQAERAAMFAAEAAGLAEIAASGAIRVPRPITHGSQGDSAWLVLEWLDLTGGGDCAELGRRLAAMHRVTWRAFGWQRDNTIGATHQPNPPTADWIDFYRAHRLRHQMTLAQRNGAPARLLDDLARLSDGLAGLFAGHAPAPSLLHGDLWGGNHGFVAGEPVLFDPAVYYGDREADLAMTELFGGFPPAFYAAYRAAWPLDAGYATRRTLYNLYHVLNHFNLFGGGYAGQARRMTAGLLAELG